MANTELLANAIVGVFVIFCLLGVVAWCVSAYHMWKLMHAWHPGRDWGRFVLFSPALPWVFTDEGNFHRVRLLRWAGLFVLCIGLAFGTSFAAEWLGVPFGA